MVANALERLDLDGVDLLWIENVGNLVCPVGFDLGHEVKIGLLSVTEGEDKIAKYPRLWREADLVLLSKVDLLPYVPFDRERFVADLRALNETVSLIEVSATTGHGLADWYAWIEQRRSA
jgi:hydrogenase nickel incorporation protein HypB